MSRDYAEARVADGSWRRMYHATAGHIGYQACSKQIEGGGASLPSSCVLSRRETEMIAGLHGSSRTASMTEEQKQLRVARIAADRQRYVAADDAVECALAKRDGFLRSANVRGDRAVRVYPKG